MINAMNDERAAPGSLPLEAVIDTRDLERRPCRVPDFASENRALLALIESMREAPDSVLERLSATALRLCGAHSAGLSLLDERRQRFRWAGVVGRWAEHVGGGTPRAFGPCGTVLDLDAPQLFSRPERHFAYLASVRPYIEEGLLLPFRVNGEAVGTIWVIAHDDRCRFDREHLRVMMNLATVAATIYQMRLRMQALAEATRLAEQLEQEKLSLESELGRPFPEIIGNSAALAPVLKQADTVAKTDATVLVLGETGVGKELIARAIHANGSRRNRQFAKLNCAAIPAALLESELFGHERGAFTDARAQKIGRFEVADGGTLFLDEIGDLPLELQPKLLRVLQEQEFERLGGSRTIRVDVRVIAATNRNLAQMVAEGRFREDLYYRLRVFPITVPPLRDRREDIPALASYFVRWHADRLHKVIDTIPADALHALKNWHWPGNVRELANFLERAVILTEGNVLYVPSTDLHDPVLLPSSGGTLEAVERNVILHALKDSRGVIAGPRGAAAKLGLKRTTLAAKMQRLGISRRHI
jgi:formate hydrogenlyase transcriptional activator